MDAESLAQLERIVTSAVNGAEGRLRGEMQAFREDLGEKIEGAERHTGTLFEETLQRIDLVVEGHQALHQKIEAVEARIEHEALETRALMQLSYRQLQDRVQTLEQKVHLIEKRLGFTN